MFAYARNLDHVPIEPAAVLELHVSVNQPAIAAEGLDAQEARAIFVSGHGEAGVEAYVYLHMLTSNRGLVYRWMDPISKADYPDVQAAVIQFTESMGFMMEDMQYRRQSPAERDRLAAELPVFRPLAPEQAAEPAAPPGAAPVELEAAVFNPETVLDLSLDAPSTQVGYAQPEKPPPAGADNPLEDKNFKVFLRLLTSV